DFTGTMLFAIPYMTIDPVRDKLKVGTQLDSMAIDPKWHSRLASELVEAPVELTVELGETGITLNDLINLSAGDTIILNRDCRSELSVKIEGIEKFTGLPGVQGGNKAIQITSSIPS
ncbi:MAG: flagellar motor switch protein FliM, partial [Geobacter sp.]